MGKARWVWHLVKRDPAGPHRLLYPAAHNPGVLRRDRRRAGWLVGCAAVLALALAVFLGVLFL